MKPLFSILATAGLLAFMGCSNPVAKPSVLTGPVRTGMTEEQVLSRLGEPDKVIENGRVKYLGFPTPELNANVMKLDHGNLFWVRLVDGRFESFTKGTDLAYVPTSPVPVPAPAVAPAPAPAPVQALPVDLRAELERLNKLKADGLINEEEHQALRKRVIEKAKQ
ncbi:hypothetical protein [Holophaga foetida]|uniref:hypothetical protein n=1 Tax=Holophaga foetida TaxID=35839 RepID=UPI0002472148|nr:hypothetical protein [Holophaga foetida]